MSSNKLFEGWLTKSPPNKRIWRTKWRRRWFVLRQSGDVPGQHSLDYYTDSSCRRQKGCINLDLCEQVDVGLQMNRNGNGTMNSKRRGLVFTILTRSRLYHLEADCEADMVNWVDVICGACGLRSSEDASSTHDTYQNSAALSEQQDIEGPGAYIPISECITGERAQQQAFTFDPKRIVTSSRPPHSRSGTHMFTRQTHERPHTADMSENESNVSDEDQCSSLNARVSTIRNWRVTKTFTKLSITPKQHGITQHGPPVPPRPPKTLSCYRERLPTDNPGPEEDEIGEMVEMECFKDSSQGGPSQSTVRKYYDDDDLPSLHYSNLPRGAYLPPAVDRALKPRFTGQTFGYNLTEVATIHVVPRSEIAGASDTLQYLDLDLHTSQPSSSRMAVSHARSVSVAEPECVYKTVDFLKTEAFNITRQDAEASRSSHK